MARTYPKIGSDAAGTMLSMQGLVKPASQTLAEFSRGGVVPGDDPGADRSVAFRENGLPPGPQGKRHYGAPHSGRDRVGNVP